MDRLLQIRASVEQYLGRGPQTPGRGAQPQDVLFIPGLTARPWYERSEFSWVEGLEAQADAIRAELHALVAGGVGFQPYVQPGGEVQEQGGWDVYYFSYYSRRYEQNRLRCPVTSRALDAVPRNTGIILFSALTPGTHIAAHIGPTNARLTCHLGVDVPDGCTIRVDDEVRTWTEGRTIVFDDSFEHEVWHRGARARYVLLFQVWHPDLTDAEVAYLEHVQRTALSARLKPYYDGIERGLRGSSATPRR